MYNEVNKHKAPPAARPSYTLGNQTKKPIVNAPGSQQDITVLVSAVSQRHSGCLKSVDILPSFVVAIKQPSSSEHFTLDFETH